MTYAEKLLKVYEGLAQSLGKAKPKTLADQKELNRQRLEQIEKEKIKKKEDEELWTAGKHGRVGESK